MREPGAWWNEPGPFGALLGPLGAIYNAIAVRRLRQAGERVPVPVICVGNPTVGGAGKTPTAIALARLLQAEGRYPAFLSRGYGGRRRGPLAVAPPLDAGDVGDEPLLLARVAPTIVARDRRAGARAAIAAGADLIVMDDGFQNPALIKDFALLVVDGRRGVGNGRLLPAGPLRADLRTQMARAHALLVVGEDSLRAGPAIEAAKARDLPVWRARLSPDPSCIAALRGRSVIAFAGIGDPGRFFAMLESLQIRTHTRLSFADHHRYTAREADDLLARADRHGLALVTTEKDHVRLTGADALTELARRTRAVPVVLAFDQEDAVRAGLLGAIRGAP